MSAVKMEMGTEGFALLTRIFMSLKRAGRVVDVVWFQQSPEYAQVVLGLIEDSNDAEGHEAARRLRELLDANGFLPAARNAPARPALTTAAPEPLPTLTNPVNTSGEHPAADTPPGRRYTTTLR
jgi:hypothetical protein